MTGYTVHTGSTEKFSQGWDQIFSTSKAATPGSTRTKKAAVKAQPAVKPTASAGKPTAKKSAKSQPPKKKAK